MSHHLKVGVIGVGAIGCNHARIYSELAEVEFVGIVDANTERCAEIADKYGCRVFRSVEEIAPFIDAASIAVPTVAHHSVAKELIEQNVHVLIEKPIANNVAEAQQLSQWASQRNLILQVGHIERFNPVMAQLEEVLDKPRFIESHRLSPFPNRSIDIGVVLDLMIHDLEIILHLVKSPLLKIDAVGIPVMTKQEDIANVRLRFSCGCIANITVSRVSSERMRKIRVFQEDAYLSLDYANQSGTITRLSPTGPVRQDVEVEQKEPLTAELSAFVECAREGRQPLVSGQEGARALELALEITKLIASGGGEKTFSTSPK